VVFPGVEVSGGARFEFAENLRGDVDLIIGRPEIDSWDIFFIPEGPKPRKAPIAFEVIQRYTGYSVISGNGKSSEGL